MTDEIGDVVDGDVFNGRGQVKVFKGEIACTCDQHRNVYKLQKLCRKSRMH